MLILALLMLTKNTFFLNIITVVIFIDFRAKYVIRWYLGDDLLTDADGNNLNAEVLLTGELMAALGGKSPIGEEVGLNH